MRLRSCLLLSLFCLSSVAAMLAAPEARRPAQEQKQAVAKKKKKGKKKPGQRKKTKKKKGKKAQKPKKQPVGVPAVPQVVPENGIARLDADFTPVAETNHVIDHVTNHMAGSDATETQNGGVKGEDSL